MAFPQFRQIAALARSTVLVELSSRRAKLRDSQGRCRGGQRTPASPTPEPSTSSLMATKGNRGSSGPEDGEANRDRWKRSPRNFTFKTGDATKDTPRGGRGGRQPAEKNHAKHRRPRLQKRRRCARPCKNRAGRAKCGITGVPYVPGTPQTGRSRPGSATVDPADGHRQFPPGDTRYSCATRAKEDRDVSCTCRQRAGQIQPRRLPLGWPATNNGAFRPKNGPTDFFFLPPLSRPNARDEIKIEDKADPTSSQSARYLSHMQ